MVGPGEGNVLPTKWGQMRDHILGHWVADFGYGADGLLEVDCVFQIDDLLQMLALGGADGGSTLRYCRSGFATARRGRAGAEVARGFAVAVASREDEAGRAKPRIRSGWNRCGGDRYGADLGQIASNSERSHGRPNRSARSRWPRCRAALYG